MIAVETPPLTPLGRTPPRFEAFPSASRIAPPSSHEPLRVLLVEDNPGDVRLVKEALLRDNAQPLTLTHCDTLAGALRHVAENAVDVVLLDLSLPDSHGVTTIEHLQKALSAVPVVVLTGHDEPGVAEHVLARGAQDFIAKRDLPDFPVARAISWAISRMQAQAERAMLLERLAREQERLMHDLDHARQMQLALLPRAERLRPMLAARGLSLQSRFEPSFTLGGDLWGVFDLGAQRTAVYAFDFSGHGISAALNVFRLHTLLDGHTLRRGDPAALMDDLNESLAGLLGPGQFATMFYAVIDTAADTLTWSAAGAPRPLLIDAEGRRRFLDTSGFPLGIQRGAHYGVRQAPFEAGAGLFFYSDAMTEALDPDDRFIGEEGIEALVAEILAPEDETAFDRLFTRFFNGVRLPLVDDLTSLWIVRR